VTLSKEPAGHDRVYYRQRAITEAPLSLPPGGTQRDFSFRGSVYPDTTVSPPITNDRMR